MDELVRLFWEIIDSGNFDDLERVLDENVKVYMPNTHEIFPNRKKYVEYNRAYPGRWRVDLERVISLGDEVFSIARVFNGEKASYYNVSQFKFNGNMISEIKEYWGDNGEPPAWRVSLGFSERY